MSVYKVIELVGVSAESWEEAAKAAIETAADSPTYQGWPHLEQGSRTRMDHW